MSALRWRRPAAERDAVPAAERRTVSLIRVLLLFEASLYSAVTPVLPHYAHTLHASKPAVGLLAAAYPAGLIPGSLIGGWIASRVGMRRTTIAGLVVFAIAIAAFGFATAIVSLDLLRVVQGMACGLIWGGGLTWAIATTPRSRRGSVIGSVVAGATLGTLLGPLLGTAAVAIGTQPVFCAIGLVSLALAMTASRHPDPTPADEPVAAAPRNGNARQGLIAALRSGLGLGSWLILLEAITFGAVNALLPLRLSAFGASGPVIGLTFALSAALATVISPPLGRLIDRHGAHRLIVIALGSGAVMFAVILLPRSAALLVIAIVITTGGPMIGFMAPALSIMTEATERSGLAILVATTLVNLGFALGESIGAPVAASLSQLTSDTLPFLLVSALMLVTIVPVLRHGRRGASDQPSTGSSVTSRATSAA